MEEWSLLGRNYQGTVMVCVCVCVQVAAGGGWCCVFQKKALSFLEVVGLSGIEE